MACRAVIYIRTSSEAQSENSSPVEQETDCRRLAHEKRLSDVEKYRVGNKLVEPSGSRSNRPGLLAMLKDADRDEYDVILVWREDRLYRGLRSMLTVFQNVRSHDHTRSCLGGSDGTGWHERTDGNGCQGAVESGKSEYWSRPVWVYPCWR